ncbi:MAG: hypothetical protein HYZ90_05850 [Candidatus Omnitrophica bacterium]|nr:hypothetical protein [Candidatus Omnitrophota bacterium]
MGRPFLFLRFLSSLLILSLGSEAPAAYAPRSNLSRAASRGSGQALRPMLDKAGLEESFSQGAGPEGTVPKKPRARERALIRRIQRDNSLPAMDELLALHRGFIYRLAKRGQGIARTKGLWINFEDMVDAVEQGFRKAAIDFNLKRTTGLIAYAKWWARKSIDDLIRESYRISVPDWTQELWLLRAYEAAIGQLSKGHQPLTREGILSAMEAHIRATELEPEALARRLGLLRGKHLEAVASAYHITREIRFLSGDWSAGDGREDSDDSWEAFGFDGAEAGSSEGMQSADFLERFRPVLTPPEFEVMKATLEGRLADPNWNNSQTDEGGRFLFELSGRLGIGLDSIPQIQEQAMEKMRDALSRWKRQGSLSPEEVSAATASRLKSTEERLAELGREENGSLSWEVLQGKGRIGKEGRRLFLRYLGRLRASADPRNRADFQLYNDKLTPATRKVFLAHLQDPDLTLEGLGRSIRMTKENARQREVNAFGLAVLMANARLNGPESWEGLLWKIMSETPPSFTFTKLRTLLARSGVHDRASFRALSEEGLYAATSNGVLRRFHPYLLRLAAEEKARAAGLAQIRLSLDVPQAAPDRLDRAGLEEQLGLQRAV